MKAASIVLLLSIASGCAGAAQTDPRLTHTDPTTTDTSEPVVESPPDLTRAPAPLEVEITMLVEPLRIKAAETPHSESERFSLRSDRGGEGIEAADGQASAPRVDPASIKKAVSSRTDLFGRCLSSDASVAIDAMIGPSGNVLQVTSSRSVPDEPKLRDCVVEGFKQLRFPAFESSDPARIRFDLALKRPLSY